VSFSAVKYYNPNAVGNTGLYLSGRVYTTIGGIGVAGKAIVVHISYVYGGVTFSNTVTIGPTDANGFANACPVVYYYPANVQVIISTDPVNNAPGTDAPGKSNVQVQNQPQGSIPAFCP